MPASGGDGARRRKGVPLYVWVAMIGGTIVVWIVAFAVVAMRHEEEMPTLDRKAYEAALRNWQEHGINSYDLDLVLSGGNTQDRVHLEVREGAVIECTHNGKHPQQKHLWDDWTIPNQFQMIAEDLEKAEDPTRGFGTQSNVKITLHVVFDPDLGFPQQYQRKAHGRSPLHSSWTVTSLKPVQEETAQSRPVTQ